MHLYGFDVRFVLKHNLPPWQCRSKGKVHPSKSGERDPNMFLDDLFSKCIILLFC